MKEFFLEPADFGIGFLLLTSVVVGVSALSKFVSFVMKTREKKASCDWRTISAIVGENLKSVLLALVVCAIIILFIVVGSFAMSIITNIIINTFNFISS